MDLQWLADLRQEVEDDLYRKVRDELEATFREECRQEARQELEIERKALEDAVQQFYNDPRPPVTQ